MNIFNKTFWKYTRFLHQKCTKWSILKFKLHNSKISLVPLRLFLAVQTEIIVSVAWLRNFRSFKAAMKRLRHVDVTMTLTSNGVVIRGLPNWSLYFYCQAVENVFADDKLFVHCIQNCELRQQHVHLFQDVKTRYFCNLLIAWTAN